MRLLMNPVYDYLARGLEQELFFMGQDALGGERSLLKSYGFDRRPRPARRGSHRYRMMWVGQTLELHSFCFGIYSREADGFVFIRAGKRACAYLGSDPVIPGNYREDLMIFPTDAPSWKKFYDASRIFLEWLEHYEGWVEKRMGVEYRRRAHALCPAPWLDPQSAREWFRLYRTDVSAALKAIPAADDSPSNARLVESRRLWRRVEAGDGRSGRWVLTQEDSRNGNTRRGTVHER